MFQFWVFAELGGWALQHEASIIEDISALRHVQTLHNILLDQQKRDPLLIDRLDKRE